jgi:peptidoglycan hydrolase-like protein with peptidoglycan-binding domain
MAVYHQGMTDEFIKRIQQVLKEAGYYRGAIDGIFGPQTFAAVKGWQHQNNLTVDGIVGPQTLAAMGLSGSSSPGSGSTGETIGISPSPSGGGAASGDATDDPNTRFVGLPGHPKVWRDSKTGDVYIVYTVDNLKPPVPLLWKVPSEADLKVFFGNKPITYDRTLTTQQIISAGGVIWGSTDQILAFEGHPWAGFHERMERAMETQPWLRDPEDGRTCT